MFITFDVFPDVGKIISEFFFFVFCLPAIACLLLISAIDLILRFFQENFSEILLKSVQKQPLFIFFIVLMAGISVFFVLYQITKVKFTAANPNSSHQLQRTLSNFVTSIIYMIVFPTLFFLALTCLNSVSTLITNFITHGNDNN
jgi:hypothetical protein